MTTQPLRLKALLRERHLQTYGSFKREYEKAAQAIDAALVTSAPSRAQFARWLSGGLKGLPYSDHCAVLEKMLPGWTIQQLFEPCPENDAVSVYGGKARRPLPAGQDGLLHLIGDRLDQPEAGDPEWGPVGRGTPVRRGSLTAALTAPGAEGVSEEARRLGNRLLELRRERDFGDEEIRQLAGLTGYIVELSQELDIDISAEGNARLAYHFDLLNLSSKPLTQVARELWFEHTQGALVIMPAPDSERRVTIQRIHDTSNLAKFAFQISPPLRPGEQARVGYWCDGGRFVDNHYWRQAIPRYTWHHGLRVRQQNVQLVTCTATEEYPDGAEKSATDSLTWDYESGGVVLSVTRDYLRPGQAVTLRWEVIRGSA